MLSARGRNGCRPGGSRARCRGPQRAAALAGLTRQPCVPRLVRNGESDGRRRRATLRTLRTRQIDNAQPAGIRDHLGVRVVSACWNKPELVLAVSPSPIASAMVITGVLLGDGNQRRLLHPLWSDNGLLRLIVETDDADETYTQLRSWTAARLAPNRGHPPPVAAGTLAASARQHCATKQGCRDAHIHFLAAPAFARYHATVASMPSRSGISGSHPASRKTEMSNSLRGVPSGLLGSQRVWPA